MIEGKERRYREKNRDRGICTMIDITGIKK